MFDTERIPKATPKVKRFRPDPAWRHDGLLEAARATIAEAFIVESVSKRAILPLSASTSCQEPVNHGATAMNSSDDRTQPADADPLLDQIRPEPNPELVRQHEERSDSLDEAIVNEHERVDTDDADIVVKDRRLNPPPADEYD